MGLAGIFSLGVTPDFLLFSAIANVVLGVVLSLQSLCMLWALEQHCSSERSQERTYSSSNHTAIVLGIGWTVTCVRVAHSTMDRVCPVLTA